MSGKEETKGKMKRDSQSMQDDMKVAYSHVYSQHRKKYGDLADTTPMSLQEIRGYIAEAKKEAKKHLGEATAKHKKIEAEIEEKQGWLGSLAGKSPNDKSKEGQAKAQVTHYAYVIRTLENTSPEMIFAHIKKQEENKDKAMAAYEKMLAEAKKAPKKEPSKPKELTPEEKQKIIDLANKRLATLRKSYKKNHDKEVAKEIRRTKKMIAELSGKPLDKAPKKKQAAQAQAPAQPKAQTPTLTMATKKAREY